jgi:hypothetical protein
LPSTRSETPLLVVTHLAVYARLAPRVRGCAALAA